MIIVVDLRETALLQHLNQNLGNPGLTTVQSEVLPIGDIVVRNKEGKDLLVIERKSLADLLSSIKDGRYDEQSYRLNGSEHHNHNIIYLIEGDIRKLGRMYGPAEKQMLYSAMFSLNYYKGFSVFRSFDIEESATIICNLANKMERELNKKTPFYTATIDAIDPAGDIDGPSETAVAYSSVVKKQKKENITPQNIGEIMLSQIPGISSVTAIAIMEKFKSISNLSKEIETNPDCLLNFSYVNSKGQSRKVSGSSLANIVKYLQNCSSDSL